MNDTVQKLIQSLKETGFKMETHVFTKKELAYHKKLDKQLEKFLKEKYKHQKESEKCTMIFK